MLSCVVLERDELTARGWKRGAEFVLGIVKTQLGRRGAIDVDALVEAIEGIAPRVTRFR